MPISADIQSNNTFDFIVTREEIDDILIEPLAIQPINEVYSIAYYNSSTLPPLSIREYSYTSIPKCFFLMDSNAMDVSGILAVQNQPGLALTGKGVLVGIIDTGIDYTNPLFLDGTGQTRIRSIWDQSATTGEVPEVFLYGAEYGRELINQALEQDKPSNIVPQMDTNGHGTYLASLAAGGIDRENDFIGAAPDSELVVVKLKEAKPYLRDFYFFPQDIPLYQENDIMAGVSYLENVAEQEDKPLVILIGVGSNAGSHVGTDPLSSTLNLFGVKTGYAAVVAAGNQATAQHHFFGQTTSLLTPVAVEINVEENVSGFCVELWSYAPELVRVVVQSPTGQRSGSDFPIMEDTQTTNYIFENTTLTMDYRMPGRTRRDLLVFMRFTTPASGIWTILVYPQQTITGEFHIWLPVDGRVVFLQPEPNTTITTPGMANIPITVGGYDAFSGARYIESGRGFDATGRVKPDLCAPAVNVSGAGLRGGYVENTGTSASAAIATGAAAQVMEWGIVRGNARTMNSLEIKNLLIRGCRRDDNLTYPTSEWGYGQMDVFNAFEILRK